MVVGGLDRLPFLGQDQAKPRGRCAVRSVMMLWLKETDSAIPSNSDDDSSHTLWKNELDSGAKSPLLPVEEAV